jgi:predicted nucleic acid-binding protein
MPYLIDTNVFLRLIPRRDPKRATVLDALERLSVEKEDLYYSSQILSEFWAVCTRPATARGGYALTSEGTERKARLIERYCKLLPDSLETHQEWRRLVVAHAVMGVEVHDARLVATMSVYDVRHLLTFDKSDFKRFSGITVVSPAELA